MKKNLTTYQILSEIIAFYGLNGRQFSEKIGVNPTYFSDVKNGKVQRLSNKMIDKILVEFPAISRTWLLTGEGVMTNTAANVVANNSDNTAATISVGNTTTDSDRLLTLTESQQSTIDKQTDTINRQSAIIGDLTASVCELAAKLAKLLPG